jgi:hypothetical protein
MAEQYYAFIKNNRVTQVTIFADKDETLADAIANDLGYDDAVWCGDNNPVLYSEWDGNKFTEPTLEYLVEIGVRDAIELLPLDEQEAIIKARLETK